MCVCERERERVIFSLSSIKTSHEISTTMMVLGAARWWWWSIRGSVVLIQFQRVQERPQSHTEEDPYNDNMNKEII